MSEGEIYSESSYALEGEILNGRQRNFRPVFCAGRKCHQ